MKNLSLGWKAAILILANVVVTFGLGLIARDHILNPKLALVEKENDQRALRQLASFSHYVMRDQLRATNEVATLLELGAGNSGQLSWQFFHRVFSFIRFEDSVHFGLAANHDGSFIVSRLAKSNLERLLPVPSENREIIADVMAYAKQHPGKQAFSTALMLRSGPVILSARILAQSDLNEPYYVVLVFRLDEAYFREIAENFGLHLKLVSLEEFRRIQAEERALSGIRSVSDRIGWAIKDWQDYPVLTAELKLPPKSYDDKILTPTIILALLATLGIWIVLYTLLHRTIIRPIIHLGDTLKEILEDRNYDRGVQHPFYDEIGRLIHYCNKLLAMVSRQTAELEQLSLTDTLTGLDNRRGFEVHSEKCWQLASRSEVYVGVVALDIDYFKRYNDTYGHPAGDKVIQQVASIISQVFKRAVDVTARVGGEEFVVLTLDAPPEKLRQLADKVLEKLRRLHIEHSGNEVLGIVTASAGALSLKVSDSMTMVDALSRVDELLYVAKMEGRNRVVCGGDESSQERATS